MKKILSLALVGLLSVGLLAGCGNSKTAETTKGAEQQAEVKKPVKIRIGYQPSSTVTLLAKENKWFEEEFAKDGIAIEYEKFIAGPPLIEAFAGGRLDVGGEMGDQPPIQARSNGIKINIIGSGSSSYKTSGLVVPNGSAIKGPKDLKGKKVGIMVGSASQRLLYLYLKANGLTPKDITIVNLSPADIKTALAAGNIDATVLWEPWISTIEVEKIGTQIADGTGYKLSAGVWIAQEDFAKEYPEIVARILKVYARSEKFINENPEQAIEKVAKAAKVKPEVFKKVLAKSNYGTPAISEDIIKSIGDSAVFLRDSKIIRSDVDINELIDTSYLKAAGIE